ncbi:MAG TPA: hypothetical protein VNI52_14485 [Sphingobacteriaceae bacterium]|nr:hypothetical protein [Sphingobacteriaceae bacterium]
MVVKKKGLQKFTESEKKVNDVMSLERITKKDVEHLSDAERISLNEIIAEKLNKINGEERDELIYKLNEIMPVNVKNQLWENNHYKITCALTKCINDYGTMPTKNQLAEETGLSRQTIHKHINDYATNPLYLKELDQFRFLSNKVLSKVFKYAINGDLKACRLYMDIVGGLNNQIFSDTKKVQQNNFIQINNTVLSQDELKELNIDQLNSIETVLKNVLPQKEKIVENMQNENKNDNVSDNRL